MDRLKNLIKEIEQIEILETLSDSDVMALLEIHLTISCMLAANHLESEYGSVEARGEALKKLYDICCKRSRSNQSKARRSRMITSMYSALYMSGRVLDERKYEICMNRSFAIIDEWRNTERELSEKERMTEYGVLRCMVETFAYVAEEDKSKDKDFCWLQSRLGEWVSDMNTDGSWSGLSNYESLQRLEILISNSNTHCDTRFDVQIEKSVDFYFRKIQESGERDGKTLYYLYKAMTNRMDYSGDSNRIDEIVSRCAESGCQSIWNQAVIIDRECMNLNNILKQLSLSL